MYKFKKRTTNVVLYCLIVIFVIFAFYSIYNMYNNESKNIESFSLREKFHSQKRKFKKWKKNHISKYTSKINRFFKSVF